jgi:microcystin-dependent protein
MGVGTWEAFGGGKVLVGVDTSATPDTDFDTVEETGGSKTHTLTEAEMPAHNHKGNFMMESSSPSNDFASGTDTSVANPDGNVLDHTTVGSASKYNPITSTTGSGDAHNNVQPYITVYFWKRTA